MALKKFIYFVLMIILIISLYQGCWKSEEYSYTAPFSKTVITIKWDNDSIYRVYINEINNPSNKNYLVCRSNSRALHGFDIFYNELSTDSIIYIQDGFNNIKVINLPDYKVFYLNKRTNNLLDYPKGNISKFMEYRHDLIDSIRCVVDYYWFFNDGNWDVNVFSRKKKNISTVRLYFYDRDDKTFQ